MFASWFDERFVSAGAQSFRLSPLRIAYAGLLWLVLAHAAGMAVASAWSATVLAVEIPFRAVTKPMLSGQPVTRRQGWTAFAVTTVAIAAWSWFGVLMWGARTEASDIAAAAFFGGHLLYIEAHHSRSPGALAPAIPALIMPMATLIVQPHFHGFDQGIILVIMTAVIAHAVISVTVSAGAYNRLLQATGQLKVERDLAEFARTEMSQAKEAAEAANAAKSAFLATMSHEIRTPLNGVLGMAQAMAAEPRLPARQRQRLGVIRQSGEALLALLNDILDLSKVEAGKLELEKVEFDLGALAFAVQQAFEGAAERKGLGFGVEVSRDAEGVYHGDPTRIRQILFNLISNALKFTEAGEVRLAVDRSGDRVRIRVSDTGIGIAPEHLTRLFAKFEQADASTTRRFGGAGLGLSICRELAQLMGGVIGVESRHGQGSVFCVELPLERVGEARASATADRARGPVETSVLKVLAAEDNAVNQLVLKTLLGQMGVEPTVVETGVQAVTAWETGAFHLILMDIQMPEMDGVAAAREIRRREAQSGRSRTPIIALTANAMSHQVSEYLAAGMDGHLAKPIDVQQLFAVVSEASAQDAAPASDSKGMRRSG